MCARQLEEATTEPGVIWDRSQPVQHSAPDRCRHPSPGEMRRSERFEETLGFMLGSLPNGLRVPFLLKVIAREYFGQSIATQRKKLLGIERRRRAPRLPKTDGKILQPIIPESPLWMSIREIPQSLLCSGRKLGLKTRQPSKSLPLRVKSHSNDPVFLMRR